MVVQITNTIVALYDSFRYLCSYRPFAIIYMDIACGCTDIQTIKGFDECQSNEKNSTGEEKGRKFCVFSNSLDTFDIIKFNNLNSFTSLLRYFEVDLIIFFVWYFFPYRRGPRSLPIQWDLGTEWRSLSYFLILTIIVSLSERRDVLPTPCRRFDICFDPRQFQP